MREGDLEAFKKIVPSTIWRFSSPDQKTGELRGFLSRQVAALWPFDGADEQLVAEALPPALGKILTSYGEVKDGTPRYRIDGLPCFSPLHSDQDCVFLHYLRKEAARLDPVSDLPDKLFGLNKMLHSVDFYSADLPDHFMVSHPLGAVIGRADFKPGGHLLIYQGTTIGGSFDRENRLRYPYIGDHVILYAGASVVGRAEIGGFSILGLGATVKNEIIPPHSLVFGVSPALTVKPLSLEQYAAISPYQVKV
jgi:serine O-acetyltransferase